MTTMMMKMVVRMEMGMMKQKMMTMMMMRKKMKMMRYMYNILQYVWIIVAQFIMCNLTGLV